MERIALVSHVIPPSPSGQAVVLYRIFSGISTDKYYLISTESCRQNRNDGNTPFRLSVPSYDLQPVNMLKTRTHFNRSRYTGRLSLIPGIYSRARKIVNILHHEPTSAILACSGDLSDIPAGFLASRIARIPFYAYIFDDFVYQWIGNSRRLAYLISPYIFRHSTGIICPNEFLCDEYKRRYGREPVLVHNPCDQEGLNKEPLRQWPAEPGKIKIVYTGAIYHANADCFRSLIMAMDALPEYPLELHIYTSQSREQLEDQGITDIRLHIHSHIPYNEIQETQHSADILFLPLAFESPISEVIRTSAPGKMGEYLASGRPILVHAPSTSYLCWYFQAHQCGAIADENNPTDLANVLRQLITDGITRTAYISSAKARARADFDPAIARSRLINLLNIS